LEYFFAEKNAMELAARVRSHIRELSSAAWHLDLFAHSLGNRLMLEALHVPTHKMRKKLVRNFYSLAPAVKDDAIEIDHKFYRSVQHCEKMFVFHSDQDEVLKIAFFLAEWSKALGYEGFDNRGIEPKNVQFVDCTELVDGHSAYFDIGAIYSFLKNQQAKKILNAQNVRLLADGAVVQIAESLTIRN